MWIYFDSSMIATTRIYDTPIRQGDIGDEIFVVFANYTSFLDKFVTLQIEYPNGSLSPEVPMIIGSKLYNLATTGNFTNNTNYNGANYEFDDNSWFEQFGLHKMTIRVYTGVNIQPDAIESTGLFSFNVEKTVFQPTPDISLDQYQYLLSLIEGLQNPTLLTTVAATVINDEVDTLTTGTAVYISGVVGASGKLRVKRASASFAAPQSNKLFGVIADPITSGSEGLCVVIGLVSGFTTTGLVAGNYVYLGLSSGTLAAAAPEEPNHRIIVGIAERIQTNTGSIYVRPQIGMDLDELCDVKITTPATGDIIRKNGSNVWVNTDDLTIAETNILGLGSDKVNKTRTIIGIDLQDDITLEEFKTALGTATQTVDGLLSSTDKIKIDELISLLDDDNLEGTVDTINEILAIFNEYPEGADLVTALAGKVDKIEGKGLSTNDYTTTEKENAATAFAHVSDIDNPHNVTKTQLGLSNVDNTSDLDKPISTATQNALNLKADLVEGKILQSQLPSYVDDVLEVYVRVEATPTEADWFSLTDGGIALTPEIGKIYIVVAGELINKTYRWGGTHYALIGEMALGTTAATAFPGDRGLAVETAVNAVNQVNAAVPYWDTATNQFKTTENLKVNASGQLVDTTIRNSGTTVVPLTINSIASTTVSLQEWQFNNSLTARIMSDGVFRTDGVGNLTNLNNSRIYPQVAGALISRNVADANHALRVNLANVSSEGNIANFQFAGDNKLEITKDGFLTQNGTRLFHQTVDTTNTFLGNEVANLTLSGTSSVAIGRQAFQNATTANSITAIGHRAFRNNTTGSRGVAVGLNAGLSLTTGQNSTFLGTEAGNNASQLVSATNSTAIGYEAYTDASNQMVFGNSNVTEFKFDRNESALAKLPRTEIVSSTFPPLQIDRRVAFNLPYGAMRLLATNQVNMTNAFGVLQTFSIRDDANVINDIARIGAFRSGADNSGRLTFNTTNAGTDAEKMTILPNGNVGIGTTTPNLINAGSELTISGVENAFLNLQGSQTVDGNNVSGLVFHNLVSSTNTNIASVLARRSGANNSGRLIFQTNNDGTNSEKMTILPSGNVGIGTTAPATLLSVVTESNTDGIQIRRNSSVTNDYSGIYFIVSTLDSTANYAEIRAVRTKRETTTDTDLRFLTRSSATTTEKMRIRDDGLVGIGETAPTAQLQVKSGATDRVGLIVDTLASQTANLQEWKVNGSSLAFINTNGRLRTNQGVSNLTSSNFSYVNVGSTGTIIERNIADSNTALIVNQANAGSTGKIVSFQFAGVEKSFIDKDGNFSGASVIPTYDFLGSRAGTAGDGTITVTDISLYDELVVELLFDTGIDGKSNRTQAPVITHFQPGGAGDLNGLTVVSVQPGGTTLVSATVEKGGNNTTLNVDFGGTVTDYVVNVYGVLY
jgi:hypothetical protein